MPFRLHLLTAVITWSLLATTSVHTRLSAKERDALEWSRLPSLPDKEGFAGMFVGVSDGILIAAGGVNFPAALPWDGGQKQFYDSIFILSGPKAEWKLAAAHLPRPIAYGVSLTCKEGILCVGGSDAARHYADVFLLQCDRGVMTAVDWPSLPRPCAQMCGAVIGDVVYIAGGLETPDAVEALHTFWALDLSLPQRDRHWKPLPPWPGPERMQAVAAVADGSLFVLSGIQLRKGPDGQPQRVSPYLRDGYRYTPGNPAGNIGKWVRIADLPRGVAAAPTPAVVVSDSRFAVLGGLNVASGIPIQRAPPLPRPIIVYDALADKWSTADEMPEGTARVTVSTTLWNGSTTMVSGERSPGRRSPEVWLIGPQSKP